MSDPQDADRYMTSSDEASAVTRIELAMIRSVEAFSRWCFFLNKSVSNTTLGAQDVWLLHSIRMRAGGKNLSELLMFLNRNDVSTLQYSLKKLEQSGLVERTAGNSRREAGYKLTELGQKVTEDYAALREELLVALVADVTRFGASLESAAAALERLTGIYDQSTQAVLNRKILGTDRK